MKALQKKSGLVPNDNVLNNVAIIFKRYYVEAILKITGAVEYENKIYCKTEKSCDDLIEENTKYYESLIFKVTEKEKIIPIIMDS